MTSRVDEALTDPSLTSQERANLELVVMFRSLPFSARSKYTIHEFRPVRVGMANLAVINDVTGPGYREDSIPDRTDEITGIIAHGDWVWATWIMRGTHLGELYGISATGKTIAVAEVGQWRIQDGLIAEAWFMVDELALVRQLGLWPDAPDQSHAGTDKVEDH
jgi:hypothetical protein